MATKRRPSGNYFTMDGKCFRSSQAARRHYEKCQRRQAKVDANSAKYQKVEKAEQPEQ